jgi:hypothetical protein
MYKIMNGYVRKDWEQLKMQLKEAFGHAMSRVYTSTRLYSGLLCNNQQDHGHITLKANIIAYDNISRIIIHTGALAND